MKLLKYTLLAAAAMMLTACGDELSGTDWSAGAPSDAPGVYFAPENETYMALLDGNGSVASLVVKRISCEGELTVPVIVKNCDENMVIPESITFADGSYETVLEVNCENVPAIVNLPLELTFPEEFINPYAAGVAKYEGTVIVSRWENVSGTGTTEFSVVSWNYGDAGFEPISSPMYHLLGSDRYRIGNFLNTGIDFTFELIPSPYQEGQYRVVPLASQLLLTDYGYGDYSYYNAWWLVDERYDIDDEEGDYWPNVTFNRPNGTSLIVYYLQFLWYDEGTKSEYCYVLNRDKGTPKAYMAFYGNADEDMEKYISYYRLRFEWTERPDGATGDSEDPTGRP